MSNRAWRLLAIAYAIVLIALSLLPPPYLPAIDLGLGDKVEHFMAYAILAVLAVPAWRQSLTPWLLAPVLIAFGGLLELAQSLSPGRMTDWLDFTANAAGVALGLLLAQAVLMLRRRPTTTAITAKGASAAKPEAGSPRLSRQRPS